MSKFDYTYSYQYGRPDGFQTVESKIRSVAEKMKCTHYYFENWQTANVKLDKGKLPAILNVLPVTGSFELGRQQIKDFPNVIIEFVDKIKLDFDGKEADSAIERCKAYAQEFILRLNASGLFEPVGRNIPYTVVYGKYDANVTGIMIELNLKEVHGLVLCPGKEIEEIVYGNGCGCKENITRRT